MKVTAMVTLHANTLASFSGRSYLQDLQYAIWRWEWPGNDHKTVKNLAFGCWSPEELQALQEADPDFHPAIEWLTSNSMLTRYTFLHKSSYGSAIAAGNECMGG